MKQYQRVLIRWLPFAVLATAMSGLIYVAVQHDIRQTANDPQIELAEDASHLLAAGQPPQIFGTNSNFDIAKSLVSFLIIYDKDGKPINGTASLDGTLPTPPKGVFEAATRLGQNRLTWEPKPGVRIASVVVRYEGKNPGYVLAGRSLREIDKRVDRLMVYVFVGWIISLASTLVFVALQPNETSRSGFEA